MAKKVKKKPLLKIIILHLSDTLILLCLFLLFLTKNNISDRIFNYFLSVSGLYLLVKTLIILFYYKYFFFDIIIYSKRVINEFKKGKFILSDDFNITKNNEFANISKDLIIIGRHINDIILSQKNEIDKLNEIYSNIIFSISSYFLVLNDKKMIIFANNSFCKKFDLELNAIVGKSINDIFIFISENIKESISTVKSTEKFIIFEKLQFVSQNKTSIIANIKISSIIVNGDTQIIILIDDITSSCKNKHHENIIQKPTDLKKTTDTTKLLRNILNVLSSIPGMEFERVMLFLYNEQEDSLEGKMSLGSNSLEMTSNVGKSLYSKNWLINYSLNTPGNEDNEKNELLMTVLKTKFQMERNNIFVQSFNNLENIHIKNSNIDKRIDESIKNFMNVKEFIIVPLIIEKKSIGIIVVDNIHSQRPIENDQVEILSKFAIQVAYTIEHYTNFIKEKKKNETFINKQKSSIEFEKSDALGKITAYLAHEIRNPLVTIGGYARRILQHSNKYIRNNEMIHKAVNIIINESERLENILSNVMDIQKPPPYLWELNTVNTIIVDTCDLLKNQIQEKGIRLILSLNEKIPMVKSDLNQIKQAMLNVLINSIDATPFGGMIEIETDLNDKKELVIIIKDSGIGIKIEDKNTIFEPFYTTKVKGFGLGLAIVKKIINNHKGEITVKNREKGGIEFKIILKTTI